MHFSALSSKPDEPLLTHLKRIIIWGSEVLTLRSESAELRIIRFKINLSLRFKMSLKHQVQNKSKSQVKTVIIVTTLRTELRGIFRFYGYCSLTWVLL